ncbi:CPBP family intramembrane glutamic endopeptidase [Nocardiopsis sp. NRRL B-16309]|uniref:CPBP family intramembrane glutamic endopeptidase n=1 Tax=Nocardiopsis sp. NRRL B-16309 TaxID=1519494 RepID=UPI0006AEF29F|nr:CPBP family intramembrane glutamic endopeptidase [Nocardiopsis sp. NRRL B-16309]KOX16990.1 CAAX protease [Nocardiopsis sp. NRRL B-16309]
MDDPTPVPPDTDVRVHERRPPLAVRVLAVTAAAFLIWRLVGWVDSFFPGEEVTPLNHTVNALTAFALALPMVWLARRHLDRRPWRGLRLTGVGEGWRPFLVGAASWALPGVAGIALCVAMGWSGLGPPASGPEAMAGLLLLPVLVLLFEALPEELIFRGYLFRNLNAAMGAWLAVGVQAVLFALWGSALWVIGSGWEVLAERLPLFLGMGVVLGCLRVLTGNVWACVGFHLVFQTVAQALLNGRYLEMQGAATLTAVAFLLPFVLGVPTAMLLARTTGRWTGRVPDPA